MKMLDKKPIEFVGNCKYPIFGKRGVGGGGGGWRLRDIAKAGSIGYFLKLKHSTWDPPL